MSRLRDRSWLDDAGHLTPSGRSVRSKVERDTDRLAAEALGPLGRDDVLRLLELLAGLVTPIADSGTIPYPNPIGVPRPDGIRERQGDVPS
jgi:hypothetical protein